MRASASNSSGVVHFFYLTQTGHTRWGISVIFGDTIMDQLGSMTDIFGPVIYAYTRQNALDDGVLIDVTETAIEAGIKFPFVVTRAVWDQYIEWTKDDTDKQSYQDQPGRLWDVVWMARHGMLNSQGKTSEMLFELYCIPRDGKSTCAKRTTLKIKLHEGDHGEAVLTVLLPNED